MRRRDFTHELNRSNLGKCGRTFPWGVLARKDGGFLAVIPKNPHGDETLNRLIIGIFDTPKEAAEAAWNAWLRRAESPE